MTPPITLDPESVRREGGQALRFVTKYAARVEPPADAVVEKSLAILRGMVAVGAILDSSIALGCETFSRFAQHAAEVQKRASVFAGFDVSIELSTWRRGTSAEAPQDFPMSALVVAALPFAKAILVMCPIAQLEHESELSGRHTLGFQCRVMYERMAALVRRLDPSTDVRLSAAGRAYAEGRLDVGEVAKILDVTFPDAVALLEAHGHARPLAGVGHSREERNTTLARVRADRTSRGGQPIVTADAIRRSVIASSRIEGVDCRAWDL